MRSYNLFCLIIALQKLFTLSECGLDNIRVNSFLMITRLFDNALRALQTNATTIFLNKLKNETFYLERTQLTLYNT